MNYRDITDLNNIILRNIHKVPNDVDLVVGVPRSGLIPALLISLYKNIPYQELDAFIVGDTFNGGARLQNKHGATIKKVLIVDDSLYSGREMNICKEKVKRVTVDYDYLFSAIFVVPESVDLVDIYFEAVAAPRVFQWNIFHHSWLTKACVDIDGVLCVDPTTEENDDGEKYEHFILNAKPLHIPTEKIDTIVSCRLEKYRKQTEHWLEVNNVKYDKLVLLDLPNQQARINWGKYGEYKAEVYLKTNNSLFIESSLKQAIIISKVTRRPVFCTETFEMINFRNYEKKYIRRFINKIKRYLRS